MQFKNIFKFNGGVHPNENKSLSTNLPIGRLPIPKKLVLPLRQHVGRVAKLKVKPGDQVLKGQIIAEADGNISASIHAPTSGKILKISEEILPIHRACLIFVSQSNRILKIHGLKKSLSHGKN